MLDRGRWYDTSWYLKNNLSIIHQISEIQNIMSQRHLIFHSYRFYVSVFAVACSNSYLALAVTLAISVFTIYFICYQYYLFFLPDCLIHFQQMRKYLSGYWKIVLTYWNSFHFERFLLQLRWLLKQRFSRGQRFLLGDSTAILILRSVLLGD